jgi:dihydrofolate synthase/folylpolyglutamate synthase
VVQHALQHIQWPGRFEKITETLILDAAHNPHAAEALVKTWRTEFPKKKASIIFGSVEDKATDGVLSKLSEIAEEFHFVPVNSERGLAPESHAVEVKSVVHSDLTSAFDATIGRTTLLTGSLFLLGEAKALLSKNKFRTTSQ